MENVIALIKKNAIIFCALIMTTSILTSCYWEPTEIKQGFSSEMVEMLNDKYGLIIPQSAVFIKGYYDNAPKDDCIWIAFTINKDDVENLLVSDKWEQQIYDVEINQFEDLIEMKPQYLYYSRIQMFTCLQISEPDQNNKVICGFKGRYPEYLE
jgi:hypothetical protein